MDFLRPRLDMRPATKQMRVVGACLGMGLAIVLTALPAQSLAQGVVTETSRPLAAVIDDYVREGLQANLSLRAQSLEVERSEAALDDARARYFPELSLDARYTWAEGGRTFELPLGAALNPAYQTLNELLMAQGQAPQFPAVQDETIAFLREREQETRITLRMPLLHPAIPAAVRAQRELLGASEYAHVALARQLEARHHRGLPALALGRSHARHRRRERGAAQRKPARQRLPAPQRQDHPGPGAARARGVAGGHPAVARSAESRRAGAEQSQLPAQPPARHPARERRRGGRSHGAHAGAGGPARGGTGQPPRAGRTHASDPRQRGAGEHRAGRPLADVVSGR